MNTEFDPSFERLWRGEDYKARAFGFGMTKQGQALWGYRHQLTDKIGADRAHSRNKLVMRALKDFDNDALALHLLVAGISVSEEGSKLGTDRDGIKNFRDMALWVGLNLRQRGEPGFKVGVWGINMLLSLPAFGLDGDILKMTAAVDDLMDDALIRALKDNALVAPLDTPPVPWTQVREGGLPAGDWPIEPLIREHHPAIENAARKAIGTGQMQPVLDAINALQRVPFTINEPVLRFMLQDGAPAMPDGEKPPTWQNRFEKWMEAFNQCIAFDTDTATATLMAAADRFWVPLNMDFRGRIYGIPHFNFGREDRVRGLFLFADGKPIGEEGTRWLKAHVARSANGNKWSKVPKPGDLDFEGRIAWTETNLEELRSVGEIVLRKDYHRRIDWALPKERYQFIAACVELVQALDQGPNFPTRLPLMFDASCSGLQHMCAMMRAETGRYANVVSTAKDTFDWTDPDDGTVRHEPAPDEGEDFYRRVAFHVWQIAPELMEHPLDREITKAATVAEFYGSRAGGWSEGRWVGMTKAIIEVLEERREEAKRNGTAPPKLSDKDAVKLAAAIYKSIGELVPEVRTLRKWLRSLARKCADKNKPLRWTTPLGLPVINEYHEAETKNILVRLNGGPRSVKFAIGDKPEISRKEAVKGAAANFVHSMDACHLQLVALAAEKEGIEIAAVHDCFGTIAPHAARLKKIIPEQFVYLHKRHDLLANVHTWAKRELQKDTPHIPKIGNAEIEDILKSFRAFS